MPKVAGFSWDDAKARSNLRVHGISFDSVARFDFDRAVSFPDDRFAYGEERWIAIGPIDRRLHVLVYTERRDIIRVISLREATRQEIRRYVDEI